MDVILLYQDFGIEYKTEGHKHCRDGFVNTECPFCTGNFGYHLSYHLENNYYVCWRCGWHPITETIANLLHVGNGEAYHILKKYGINETIISTKKKIVPKKQHRLPSMLEPLNNKHKKYLEERGFDPNKIEKEWNVLSSTPASRLDKISFKYRIVIPIIWENEQVSFTSRDTTEQSPLKYISCPEVREKVKHKSIVYGNFTKHKSTGICVEGPTDVWRFGTNSFATFGIEFTPAQMATISKLFKRVPVIYDDDPQAKIQAKKLVGELRFRGVDSFRVPIKGDPGGLKQEEANYIVKSLIK